MKESVFMATFVFVLLLSGCQEKQEPVSISPIDFAGRSTYRDCAVTTPLAGKWQAGISHGYFSDEPDKEFDFVEVTLELPLGGGDLKVPFEAAYSLQDLPDDILSKSPKELVSFDESSNTVTFDLGTTQITAQIPSP